MRVKSKVAIDQKLVLGGMIADTAVLSRIASQWPAEGLFEDEDANTIGKWCIRYLERYGQAPNGKIQSIFRSWVEDSPVDEKVKILVERKLESVSNAWEKEGEITADYVLDRAKRYFNKIRLKKAWEEAEAELDRGMVEEAFARMTELGRIEVGEGSTIKVSEDYLTWREVLDVNREEQMVYYPKGISWLLGGAFGRDNFVAFMGPDKSFKSFWIMDVGFRALKNRKRVAMFEVGDMSRDQIMGRMAERFARRPIRAGKYWVPVSLKRDEKGEPKPVLEVRECRERLTSQELYKAIKRTCRGKDLLRLEVYPNDSIDVFGIQSRLKDWERSGWVPDVVLIDYADILAPPKGANDELAQIDKTWKVLRRISQELHCLLVTGTQSSAAAYSNKQRTLGKKHFGGRKTKLAHVSGMIGLNVSDEYRENCMTGLNWVVRREGKYTERAMGTVVGCLDIANPCMKFLEFFQKKDSNVDV